MRALFIYLIFFALYACSPRPAPVAVSDDRPLVDAAVRQEILVKLQAGADAGAWIKGYSKQNVALEKRLSPNGPYYLITTDPTLLTAQELLTRLRQDGTVVSAQLNQRVEPR